MCENVIYALCIYCICKILPLYNNIHSVTPMDYGAVSTILTFAACDTRRCVDVPIMNDTDDEPDEMFTITLERTPGLNDRITLDPVDGVVIIIDDDGKFKIT